MNSVLITFAVIIGIFILFLVIVSSLNKSVDYLSRVLFLLKTEFDYRQEELEVRRVLSIMEDEDY